ncbi:MAG: motility protein A [Methylococcales bacterium]|jgi:chemotaxis protein MotA|nr:motility protein A [Methylococcales bacterium]MBT7443187.1 motility protein A [Methylococcales bacterium]
MDFASLFGIFAGISLIIGSILLGGDLESFVNVPSIMIVFGGTLAATFLTFPFKDVMKAFRAAAFVFRNKQPDPNDTIQTMVKLCALARKKGLMSLSQVDVDDPFLTKSCNLIADNADAKTIRDALRIEIDSLKMRHFNGQEVFRKMATYAPAFGMLGTLIGLIKMLGDLQDPSNIGPSMAIALLTTFYGSLLATMFFMPIAGKLKSRTVNQVIQLEIIYEGAISVLQSANPRMVYEKLSSFVPARYRTGI